MWEVRSCNGANSEGATVGVIFYGENGSLQIDGGNGYKIYDLKSKLVKEVKNDTKFVEGNLMNPSQALDSFHIQNFFSAINSGADLNSDILSGHQSTLLVQLGNIAQRSGSTLDIDPSNGHILNNPEASKYWGRDYQAGWEPKV